MVTARARFPRAAYARRAASLAEDLAAWHLSLTDYARGPENWAFNDEQIELAEARAYAIASIVHDLQRISMEISAIR